MQRVKGHSQNRENLNTGVKVGRTDVLVEASLSWVVGTEMLAEVEGSINNLWRWLLWRQRRG
jgi:hypothetical protein